MFRLLNQKKGQSTLEYAILIVIVIGALISIQVYIKRGIQGRLRSATDDIGDQYSPGNTNILITTTTASSTQDTFADGQTSSLVNNEDVTVDGSQNIMNLQQEFWGVSP